MTRSARYRPVPRIRRRQQISRIKREALKRAEYACEACGAEFNLTLHHIKPVRAGGEDSLKNACILCEDCHAVWHTQEEKFSFPRWLQRRRLYFLREIKKGPSA